MRAYPEAIEEALNAPSVRREIQSMGNYIAESAIIDYFREKLTSWKTRPYESAYGKRVCRQFAEELKAAVEKYDPIPLRIVPVVTSCPRCGEQFDMDYFRICGNCLSDYIEVSQRSRVCSLSESSTIVHGT
jgi:hypothetical protein